MSCEPFSLVPFKKALSSVVIASLLITSGLFVATCVVAAAPDTELVPEPSIELRHDYSRTIDDRTIGNEVWQLDVTDGDVTLLFMARNLTTLSNGDTWVDYQFNINYHTGNTLYIAQTTIMDVKFLIGGQITASSLSSCDKMTMTYTEVKYNGTVPSLYCNITFSGIDVYQDNPVVSTFDLTLSHHITVNWNQTDVKVEAAVDLSDMRLVDLSNNNEEYSDGTPFAVEIPYSMMLTLPNSHGEAINPTGHDGTSMQYDIMFNGEPLTVSKLTMNNSFLVRNESGSYGSEGYSSMQYGPRSQVTHGFPNLIYNDTLSIKSDPEITVFHDRIGGGLGSISSLLIYVVLIAVIAVVGVVVVVGIRRKKGKGGDK